MGSDEVRGDEQSEEPAIDHAEVVDGLLDLQRLIRQREGEEPETAQTETKAVATRKEPALEAPSLEEGSVAVAPAGDLWVIETSAAAEPEVPAAPEPETPGLVAEPDAAAAADPERESTETPTVEPAGEPRVEEFAERLARLEAEIQSVSSSVERVRDETDEKVEELRARAEETESGLIQMLSGQREELARAIDQHFARIESTISEGLRIGRKHGKRKPS